MAINKKEDAKEPKASKSAMKVIRCTCYHEFQDQICGNKMRFHNLCHGKGEYRCTVCNSRS